MIIKRSNDYQSLAKISNTEITILITALAEQVARSGRQRIGNVDTMFLLNTMMEASPEKCD